MRSIEMATTSKRGGGWGTTVIRPHQNCLPAELHAGGGLFKPVGMGPKQVEDAAPGFNSRVQIVSPPPDHLRIQKRTLHCAAARSVAQPASTWRCAR